MNHEEKQKPLLYKLNMAPGEKLGKSQERNTRRREKKLAEIASVYFIPNGQATLVSREHHLMSGSRNSDEFLNVHAIQAEQQQVIICLVVCAEPVIFVGRFVRDRIVRSSNTLSSGVRVQLTCNYVLLFRAALGFYARQCKYQPIFKAEPSAHFTAVWT